MELGVEDGVIVARTDSLGAGLTKQIAFTREAGDIADQYNSFLDCDEVDAANVGHGDVLISRDGKQVKSFNSTTDPLNAKFLAEVDKQLSAKLP